MKATTSELKLQHQHWYFLVNACCYCNYWMIKSNTLWPLRAHLYLKCTAGRWGGQCRFLKSQTQSFQSTRIFSWKLSSKNMESANEYVTETLQCRHVPQRGLANNYNNRYFVDMSHDIFSWELIISPWWTGLVLVNLENISPFIQEPSSVRRLKKPFP